MRFMTIVKGHENLGAPPPALIDAIDRMGEEAMRAGKLIETGGLSPSTDGVRVRLKGGKLTVTDGPFSEAKEVIGGYAVFELDSREQAVAEAVKFMELHQAHWPAWEGETEVRQVFGADFGRPPQGA